MSDPYDDLICRKCKHRFGDHYEDDSVDFTFCKKCDCEINWSQETLKE